MAKILAPNRRYDGITAGVAFKEGVGETTDPRLIKWFKSRGYTVKIKRPKKPAGKEKEA